MLDMRGVKRLMDLGGGSGVVSFALLRRHADLTSVVVDVENVCLAGRKLALQNALEKRIAYLAADFLRDELPTGFDMVMFCDVGPFTVALFRKIYDVLNPDGRLVVVEQFALDESTAAPSRQGWSFLSSLELPAEPGNLTTPELVQTRLQQAGFREVDRYAVPYGDYIRWNIDWILLEARK
jgi:tRNA A58 N-methylase Trm61